MVVRKQSLAAKAFFVAASANRIRLTRPAHNYLQDAGWLGKAGLRRPVAKALSRFGGCRVY